MWSRMHMLTWVLQKSGNVTGGGSIIDNSNCKSWSGVPDASDDSDDNDENDMHTQQLLEEVDQIMKDVFGELSDSEILL